MPRHAEPRSHALHGNPRLATTVNRVVRAIAAGLVTPGDGAAGRRYDQWHEPVAAERCHGRCERCTDETRKPRKEPAMATDRITRRDFVEAVGITAGASSLARRTGDRRRQGRRTRRSGSA